MESNDGEWMEFKYMDKKYRIESSYLDTQEAALLRTYEILPGSEDRSKKRYEPIQALDLYVMSKDALVPAYGDQSVEVTNPKTGGKVHVS
jgi:hypothetical protein